MMTQRLLVDRSLVAPSPCCRARRRARRGHPGLRPQVPALVLDLPRPVPAPQAVRRGVRRPAASGSRTRPRSRRAPRYDVGDPLLSLPRDLPLAVRLEGYASYERGRRRRTSTSSCRGSFKILSGGPIAEQISYYFYFILEKGEVDRARGRLPAVQRALRAAGRPDRRPVPGLRSALQARAAPRALRLPDLQDAASARSAVEPHLRPRPGRSAGTSRAGSRSSSQVVNGNGIGRRTTSTTSTDDGYKNVALRLVRPFGPVRLGVFGYWGKRGREGEDRFNKTELPRPRPGRRPRSEVAAQRPVPGAARRRSRTSAAARRDVVTGAASPSCTSSPGEDGRWALSALYNRVDSTTCSPRPRRSR